MEVEILKPAEQFKLDAERILDEARILQQNGEIEEALKKLRTCVKKAPEEVKGEDYDESNPAMRILLALGTIAFQAGGWDLLVSQIRFIMRRYNYLQFAVRKMVEKAIEFEEALPSEGRVDRIKSLCDLTEDKVYVEVLRARLTRKLSDIYKEQGNYTEAARVMQNIQIETFGSMPRVEKADFILEQIRLSLQIADYTNAAILSKKISPKYFEGEPKSEEQRDARLRQKVDYYELVIQCLLHESNYLEVSKQYQRIYNTKEIQDDDTKWPDVLRNIALYAILAPYSNEQSDFVYHIKADPKLDDLKLMPPGNAFSLLDVLNAFTTPELISWDFVLQYYAPSLQSTAIFSSSTPEGQAKWNEFRSRVREHNLRIVSKYYTSISMPRLAHIVGFAPTAVAEVESFLSDLVIKGMVYARIDRPNQTVSFVQPESAEDKLNSWANNVSELLNLVESTTHLLSKEETGRELA